MDWWGIGALVGLGTALLSTDKSVEATTAAFNKAAKTITPEFMEELNAAFAKASQKMVDNMGVLDKSVLKEMAAVQTADPAAEANVQATQASTGYAQMSAALDGATGSAGEFVEQLEHLTALKIKSGLIKGVADEISVLGEEGAKDLTNGFAKIRGSLEEEINKLY